MGNKGGKAGDVGAGAAATAVAVNKFKDSTLVSSELRIQEEKEMQAKIEQREKEAQERTIAARKQVASINEGSSVRPMQSNPSALSNKQATPRARREIRRESAALRDNKPELTLSLKKKKLPMIKPRSSSPAPAPAPAKTKAKKKNQPPAIPQDSGRNAAPQLPQPVSTNPANGVGADGIHYSTFKPTARKFALTADNMPSSFSPETDDAESRRKAREKIKQQQRDAGFDNSRYRSSHFSNGGSLAGGLRVRDDFGEPDFGAPTSSFRANTGHSGQTIVNTSASPKKKKQLNYGSQFAMPTNMRKETVFDDDEERLMDAILG